MRAIRGHKYITYHTHVKKRVAVATTKTRHPNANITGSKQRPTSYI
uniref:Uncharacterized protein n=1 Tax=Podoviridae sp. ctzXp5 TaxID=2827758 RepID=A0A8S5TFE3_9CAUD|nr:MAG TPA: hypothetical protein [Podoviridae sp. ctzXp5]DAP48293.1 MAG TPA: hypothetical protein [Caudoviricetes sp.]